LLWDEAFKRIFGNKNETAYLIRLLAAVLDKQVNAVEVLDVKVDGPRMLNDRQVYLDVLARVDGELVNVEVQLRLERYYDFRCFWHLCALMHEAVNSLYQQWKREGKSSIRHDELYGQLP